MIAAADYMKKGGNAVSRIRKALPISGWPAATDKPGNPSPNRLPPESGPAHQAGGINWRS
jgi:hypothetical protein